jgi:hypothetical protein
LQNLDVAAVVDVPPGSNHSVLITFRLDDDKPNNETFSVSQVNLVLAHDAASSRFVNLGSAFQKLETAKPKTPSEIGGTYVLSPLFGTARQLVPVARLLRCGGEQAGRGPSRSGADRTAPSRYSHSVNFRICLLHSDPDSGSLGQFNQRAMSWIV